MTFGESSSLKRIGPYAFSETGLKEIHIPDNVEEICEACFYRCLSLSHITFGESSSLKRLGWHAFFDCALSEIHIPDGVEELVGCFYSCPVLLSVTFGESSLLRRLGKDAFKYSPNLREIHIPGTVE